MRDVLAKIIDDKRTEVTALASTTSFAALDEQARAVGPVRGFAAALVRDLQNRLWADCRTKESLAVKGLIRADFAPARWR